MARVLTAPLRGLRPAPASSSTCTRARDSRAAGGYANLRVADEVVPELDTSAAPAGTPTSTAPWPGAAPDTTCRAAGRRCCRRRATCSGTTGWWSASRFPAARESLAPGGVAAARRDRATLHAAGFPSRSWTAEDPINWVSALLDPHRQTGDAIPLTYDDGRELRDQVIDRHHAPAHRPPGHRPGQPGRRPANRASPDVGARFPAALRAVERRQPDRRPLPGHAAVPLPVPAHAGRARSRRRGHPQLAFLKAARATTNATSYMGASCPTCRSARPTGTSCSRRWTTASSSSISTCSSRSSPSRTR